MEGVQDCDRQGYQEGWPDAVKVASKGYILATQKEEYQAAIAKSYRNPQSDKYFVWQVDCVSIMATSYVCCHGRC